MTPEQRDVERVQTIADALDPFRPVGAPSSMAVADMIADLLTLVRAEATREAIEPLVTALRSAISVASEAAEEWDKAPQGMRAGKLLLALCGHLKGYRADITAIHAALAAAPAAREEGK